MRALIIHSRYLSGPVSGENRVVEDEVALLRSAGHDIEMWDPLPEVGGPGSLIKSGIDTVWSRSASRRIGELTRSFEPDIVHFHNLFPTVSPAGLRTAASHGSTCVMTLHNYRLLCLPAVFVRDGRVCEDCLGHAPWRGVVHKCYRDSLPGSAALALSLTAHRKVGSFDRVSLFLAGSEFVRAKHIEAGIDAARIHVKPNFCSPARRRSGPGDFFLYLGRMSPEKGMATLLRFWADTGRKLVMVGDGPELDELQRSAPPGVEFTGAITPERVGDILHEARALLVPSVTYESAPRAVLEAYATGVPVIASRIGALPEVVEDGVSGILVDPLDLDGWKSAVEMLGDDRTSERLGAGAYKRWSKNHSPDAGLAGLEGAYEAALSASGRHRRSPAGTE
jgi:glycosyltransferase involved in cell wall biosynthesis